MMDITWAAMIAFGAGLVVGVYMTVLYQLMFGKEPFPLDTDE